MNDTMSSSLALENKAGLGNNMDGQAFQPYAGLESVEKPAASGYRRRRGERFC